MVDTTLLQGADAIYASSLPSGKDWYLYYTTSWPDADEAAVRAAFPGKKYLGLSQEEGVIPEGTDGFDMENGAWTAAGVAQHLSGVSPVNTNLPVIYCSSDAVSEITAAGVDRSSYYLFQADWDDSDSVAPGADLSQYESGASYDYDVAYAYVFKSPAPAEAKVPDVLTRRDLAFAEHLITSAGFKAKAEGDSGAGNLGSVTSQSPSGGTMARTGSTVTLTYTVPVSWEAWPEDVELREGDVNPSVKVLQTALTNSDIVGVRNITVDGDFGSQTLTSVRNFQQYEGLSEDGIAGPDTRRALVALDDL